MFQQPARGHNQTYTELVPFIYEQYVMRLNYYPRRGTPVEYATRHPEIVDDSATKQLIHSDTAFIVGWKEAHWSTKLPWVYTQDGEFPREVHVTKAHVINRTLLDTILWQLQNDKRDDYTIRSFEKILVDAGWQYYKRPTGWITQNEPDEDLGYVVPEDIQQQVIESKEFWYMNKMLAEKGGTPILSIAPQDVIKVPDIPVPQPAEKPSTDELQWKIAQLSEQVANLARALNVSTNDSSSTSEQRPISFEQDGADIAH